MVNHRCISNQEICSPIITGVSRQMEQNAGAPSTKGLHSNLQALKTNGLFHRLFGIDHPGTKERGLAKPACALARVVGGPIGGAVKRRGRGAQQSSNGSLRQTWVHLTAQGGDASSMG